MGMPKMRGCPYHCDTGVFSRHIIFYALIIFFGLLSILLLLHQIVYTLKNFSLSASSPMLRSINLVPRAHSETSRRRPWERGYGSVTSGCSGTETTPERAQTRGSSGQTQGRGRKLEIELTPRVRYPGLPGAQYNTTSSQT